MITNALRTHKLYQSTLQETGSAATSTSRRKISRQVRPVLVACAVEKNYCNVFFRVIKLTHIFAYKTGWGRTVSGGAAADILQQAMLPVVPHRQCNQINGRLIPVEESSMVCAGSGVANQAGGCQGDSGGPFVCEENGKWVLRGAVSWGNPMCRTDHYTVFARISNFLDWISKNINGGKIVIYFAVKICCKCLSYNYVSLYFFMYTTGFFSAMT